MRAHTNAVKARIQTVQALTAKTFVGTARKADGKLQEPPYVVIYPAEGTDDTDRLTGPSTVQNPRFTIHIVGGSYDNVQSLVERIKPLFVLNGRAIEIDVPGERGYGLYWSSPVPIQWDFDVPDRLYQVVELGFSSEPAYVEAT